MLARQDKPVAKLLYGIIGIKSTELKHYIQPSLLKNPAAIIMHVGINDIMLVETPTQISNELKDMVNNIKCKVPNCKFFVSSAIRQITGP